MSLNKVPRQPMPCQKPEARVQNFSEVATGYTEETALLEASRCLQCKKTSLPYRLPSRGFNSRFY